MSADLLAEFGAPNTDDSRQNGVSHTPDHSGNDADPWGDFEAPAPSKPNGGTTWSLPEQDEADIWATEPSTQARPPPIRPPLIHPSSFDLFAAPAISNPPKPWTDVTSSSPEEIPVKPPDPASDIEVLFDAENISQEDDDEFGALETVPSTAKPPSPQPTRTTIVDLLSLDDSGLIPRSPYPQAPKSPSFQERNPFADLAVSTAKPGDEPEEPPSQSTPITAWPTFVPAQPSEYKDSPVVSQNDEEWASFPESPPANAPTSILDTAAQPKSVKWTAPIPKETTMPLRMPVRNNSSHAATSRMASYQKSTPTTSPSMKPSAPPTNIPPPSVLLSLLPPLLQHPPTPCSTSLDDPIHLGNISARLIAGRKLRWKRDVRLSQGHKIAPAQQGGRSGGLKLTGIDKNEDRKEEGEVAEVVRSWNGQKGRLRSAIAVVHNRNPTASVGAVPELSETMPVQTAKEAEGGIPAPQPCVLCGLKRNERVLKVDVKVDDSFGEWWTEHWGHTECKRFWERYRDQLPQR
ncbi:MAG: hypothetical protein M1817_004813 [Caeruleum heppii]|nr:MAG: hypothetical protein M1817_004813 [Caeruleum heppii]